ncbi:hypothetical protein J6N69_03120 [bacterium]|nr:hypothetical protein [bacterium]
MNKNDIYETLEKIETAGSIVSSLIKVSANSCENNDYFEEFQVLELAHQRQESMLEIVDYLKLHITQLMQN